MISLFVYPIGALRYIQLLHAEADAAGPRGRHGLINSIPSTHDARKMDCTRVIALALAVFKIAMQVPETESYLDQ
jgi:hypothetical protein